MNAIVSRRVAGPVGLGVSATPGFGGFGARTVSLYEGLSMYTEAPREEVSLHDFEVLALDRLKGASHLNSLIAPGRLQRAPRESRGTGARRSVCFVWVDLEWLDWRWSTGGARGRSGPGPRAARVREFQTACVPRLASAQC